MKLCDYSWERPSIDALVGAGYKGVFRYISYDTTGKNLTDAERKALHAAGLDVTLNWEYSPRAALNGYAQGAADAREAQRQASQLGAPSGAAIYFSIDWNVADAEMDMVRHYFDGIAGILPVGVIGVYGGLKVVNTIVGEGRATYGWQTYAWSNGAWSDYAHVRQVANGVPVGGSTVDNDESTVDFYGQWQAPTDPVTVVSTQEDPLATWVTASRNNTDPTRTLTVQGLLLARGYNNIGSLSKLPDGQWGDHTDASVRQFQADHHVANSVRRDGTGDGIVGPNTLRALAGM